MKFINLIAFTVISLSSVVCSCKQSSSNAPNVLVEKASKIVVGMSKSEVVSVLGAPSNSLEEISGEILFWKQDGKKVVVISIDGKGKVSNISIPK